MKTYVTVNVDLHAFLTSPLHGDKFLTSGILRLVVSKKLTDVSEVLTVSIIRAISKPRAKKIGGKIGASWTRPEMWMMGGGGGWSFGHCCTAIGFQICNTNKTLQAF
jgi:hypothetical protein